MSSARSSDGRYDLGSDDKKVISAIREAYITHIKAGVAQETTPFDIEETKHHFFFNKTMAVHTPSKVTVGSAPHWVNQLKTGVCKEYAEYMLRQILEYQAVRSKKISKSSKALDDPTGLMLDEFKQWLVELSGYTDGDTQACLVDIAKRIAYLTALHDEKLFPPGRNPSFTRLQLLTKLKDTLSYGVEPFITFLPNSLCAREHFRQLLTESKCLLRTGIQFLFLVLNNQDDSLKFTEIYQAVTAEEDRNDLRIKPALSTVAGSLIKELVLQSQFMIKGEAFNIGKKLTFTRIPSNTRTPITTIVLPPQSFCLTNIYQAINDNPKNTGIEKYFLENKDALAIFVDLHELLYEFAKVVSCVTDGFNLAGLGGTLLLYGVLHNSTKSALEHYDIVLKAITSKLMALQQSISPRRAEEDKTTRQSKWYKNYKIAEGEEQLFKKSVTKINGNLTEIRRCLDTVNLEDMLKETKCTMRAYTDKTYELNHYFCDNYGALGFTRLPTTWVASTLQLQIALPQASSAPLPTSPSPNALGEQRALGDTMPVSRLPACEAVSAIDNQNHSLPAGEAMPSTTENNNPQEPLLPNQTDNRRSSAATGDLYNDRLYLKLREPASNYKFKNNFHQELYAVLKANEKEALLPGSWFKSSERQARLKQHYKEVLQYASHLTDGAISDISDQNLCPVTDSHIIQIIRRMTDDQKQFWFQYSFYQQLTKVLAWQDENRQLKDIVASKDKTIASLEQTLAQERADANEKEKQLRATVTADVTRTVTASFERQFALFAESQQQQAAELAQLKRFMQSNPAIPASPANNSPSFFNRR